MRIKNIAAKVCGVGPFDIMPGEEKIVDDSFVYEYDKNGARSVVPGLKALERTKQIVLIEEKEPIPAESEPKNEESGGSKEPPKESAKKGKAKKE